MVPADVEQCRPAESRVRNDALSASPIEAAFLLLAKHIELWNTERCLCLAGFHYQPIGRLYDRKPVNYFRWQAGTFLICTEVAHVIQARAAREVATNPQITLPAPCARNTGAACPLELPAAQL